MVCAMLRRSRGRVLADPAAAVQALLLTPEQRRKNAETRLRLARLALFQLWEPHTAIYHAQVGLDFLSPSSMEQVAVDLRAILREARAIRVGREPAASGAAGSGVT